MMSTEIISVVNSKEKGREMGLGRGFRDGFIVSIIFIVGGGEKCQENKPIFKTVFFL